MFFPALLAALPSQVPSRVALAVIKVMLAKEKESLIPPHIQLFLAMAASIVEKKEREGHFRRILRSLSVPTQAKLHRVLTLLVKLISYHKVELVARMFAPVLMKASRRAKTPSSVTLDRNTTTLVSLIETGPEILKANADEAAAGLQPSAVRDLAFPILPRTF